MKLNLQVLVQRFDALSRRDRLSLAACVLALAVGAAVLGVGPLHVERWPIEQAEAQKQRLAQLAELAELEVRGAQIEQQLAGLGLSQVSSQSPAGSIVGALHGSKAALLSLRGLPVQALAPAADSAASAGTAPIFFRHRAEICLQGSVAELTQALAVLEQRAAPLRIEQVLISSADSGPALQATVVLTAINQERTWFAL